MRNILYIVFLATFSCNNNAKQTEKAPISDTSENIISKQEEDNSIYYTEEDTIYIETEIGETLQLAKADFNNIIDRHPEFFQEYPHHPDQLYFNNNDREEI